MRKTDAFRRAAALVAALSITVSLAAPAFAETYYYIDDGDITITKDENGQTVKQGNKEAENIGADEEIIITTHKEATTTLESDLEGPAAEDSGFGPVVEDNYQPAQPEDAEEPKAADQPESTEEPEAADRKESTEEPEDADRQESADRQAQPQQAAPADAAPAAPAPVNPKGNGFFGNTITVINKAATALKLTLKDVKIDVSDTGKNTGIPGTSVKGKAALSVQGKGNVEIELDGENELKSGFNRAGLEKNTFTSTGTLTLKDDNQKAGSLKATGNFNGAGIGGSMDNGTNKIIITGGTVNATGNRNGAGIGGGGGEGGNGEDITITGGTVTATGGSDGTGIGDGAGIGGGGYKGYGKNITITGGTVTAEGCALGAGIGGAYGGVGKNITITGGTVTAAGAVGAGIGGGEYGNGEDITITGGTVTATNKEAGAGIGGGEGGNGKNITINGGEVTAAVGDYGAGIGGGYEGKGEDITITGGKVTAKGGLGGAGIGGGAYGGGEDITITGGTVTASGCAGAGIGGGIDRSGSNVTVSGAAQVTVTASKSSAWVSADTGATIGNGGSVTEDDDLVDGKEIQADIRGVTTGYIHHIIYNLDGSIKREWWEPERPKPTPDGPNAPAEESNEVDLGTPVLHVETLEGDPLPFNARQQGSTLRVTTDTLAARLHGTRQALEALREQGVEQIQFVTTLKTTTLSVEELLAEGGSWFALEHNGLGSRRLSAAQAESLKCWMH